MTQRRRAPLTRPAQPTSFAPRLSFVGCSLAANGWWPSARAARSGSPTPPCKEITSARYRIQKDNRHSLHLLSSFATLESVCEDYAGLQTAAKDVLCVALHRRSSRYVCFARLDHVLLARFCLHPNSTDRLIARHPLSLLFSQHFRCSHASYRHYGGRHW